MFRKFKADHLFTGTEMFGNDKVLITKINGEVEAIVDGENAGDNVEFLTGILSPGFINAHCHLELSHMKGLVPERTGLVDFVFEVVTKRNFSEEKMLEAITSAENEMLANGIVAVGDICNNLLTLQQKSTQRILYYNFVETSGWDPSVAGIRFERAMSLYNEFSELNRQGAKGNGQGAIGNSQESKDFRSGDKLHSSTSIVPHAPYSVSDNLWKLITNFDQNKVISIHNQETPFEDEFFLKGSGDLIKMYRLMNIDNSHFKVSKKTSVQSYFKRLAKVQSIILVHNTFTSAADVTFINKQIYQGQLISFCICANANKYIEGAIPPVEMLMQNNGNLVVGTDSLASNHHLNILEELKTISKNFPAITLSSLLKWATLNGARALQFDKMFGSFEKGKIPGVVLIKNVAEGKLEQRSTAERIL
ncbi:MAG: amidohydrolase family protein [Chitinophagaceae bacterium]|nr:amidohydrolase family protein [Chitinophagaceae bacterium]